MTDKPDTDLQALWTQQPAEMPSPSIGAIHLGARKFQTTIFWRNVREYAAAVVVVILFSGFGLAATHPMVQAGAALTVLAAIFVSGFLFLHGRADRDGARVAEGCIDFHRAALIRQRDLLRGVWLWYLLPFMPGTCLFIWGTEQAEGAVQPWRVATSIGIVVAVFAAVGLLNMWGARSLQKDIDRLPG